MFEPRCDFAMRQFCDGVMGEVDRGLPVADAAAKMARRGVPLHVAVRLLVLR